MKLHSFLVLPHVLSISFVFSVFASNSYKIVCAPSVACASTHFKHNLCRPSKERLPITRKAMTDQPANVRRLIRVMAWRTCDSKLKCCAPAQIDSSIRGFSLWQGHNKTKSKTSIFTRRSMVPTRKERNKSDIIIFESNIQIVIFCGVIHLTMIIILSVLRHYSLRTSGSFFEGSNRAAGVCRWK